MRVLSPVRRSLPGPKKSCATTGLSVRYVAKLSALPSPKPSGPLPLPYLTLYQCPISCAITVEYEVFGQPPPSWKKLTVLPA
jgi:hypothetical protein